MKRVALTLLGIMIVAATLPFALAAASELMTGSDGSTSQFTLFLLLLAFGSGTTVGTMLVWAGVRH